MRCFINLVHHLDDNQIKNDYEAPYFMLGHEIGESTKDELLCHGNVTGENIL